MSELEARDSRERELGLPSAERMRALVPEAGRFIHIIIRACQYQRILEIGTSYGYSTLWLASAAQAAGGRVDTIELAPERVAAAGEHFRRTGLGDVIEQHQGDARDVLKKLDGPFDFVFIDAEKDDYEDYLDLTHKKVVPGGMVMADNVLSHSDQLGHYFEKAQHTPGLFSVTVPIARGEEMSLRVGPDGMRPEVVATLAELEVYGRTHGNAWSVPRVAGKFLHILAIASKAKSVIELGTSTGYSGLWLASAMQQTGGRVLTIEPDLQKIKLAKQSFAGAKVAPQIDIAAGKALEVLPTLSGPFDLAFVDAVKEEYSAYIEQLWPKMKSGGLIVADNIDSHNETLGAYATHMQAHADAMSVTLHIGNGMEMTMKTQ